ncbi:hypothetical protein D3C72_1981200 [compost metagenome]
MSNPWVSSKEGDSAPCSLKSVADERHKDGSIQPMPCVLVWSLKKVKSRSARSCATSISFLPLYSGLFLISVSAAASGFWITSAKALE